MFFQENGQYRCAVYLRLSRSDGDQQESNSIKNQRALLNDYLGKHPEGLTATQLNVKTETAVVTNGENSTASFAPGDSVSILTWNVGYAGLGEESDFFMDGGKQVRAPSKAIVEKNMDGIVSTVKELDADFTFLQEIEADPSTRSYGIEEAERMRTETGLDTAHARNYKCAFVPYPIPPIGKVSSGIMTLSTAPIASDTVASQLHASVAAEGMQVAFVDALRPTSSAA